MDAYWSTICWTAQCWHVRKIRLIEDDMVNARSVSITSNTKRDENGDWRVRRAGLMDLTLVNWTYPGVIETDMGAQTFAARARNRGNNDVEAARQVAQSAHPIGRLGTPNDIAKGIVFLASDDAAFMTGAGLVVDGGLTGQ